MQLGLVLCGPCRLGEAQPFDAPVEACERTGQTKRERGKERARERASERGREREREAVCETRAWNEGHLNNFGCRIRPIAPPGLLVQYPNPLLGPPYAATAGSQGVPNEREYFAWQDWSECSDFSNHPSQTLSPQETRALGQSVEEESSNSQWVAAFQLNTPTPGHKWTF